MAAPNPDDRTSRAAAPDDAALLARIRRREAAAIGVLYDRYSRLVYSLALRIVGDSSTAEEITLDVFVRIWEHADSYRAERGAVRTWLTGITRNRAIDALRRRGARPDTRSLPLEAAEVRAAANSRHPEQAVEGSLLKERIRNALAELPPDQQRALFLAYFRGLTQREIAEALGDPLGTVKTRIRLGMEKLRRLLADEQRMPEE